MRSSKVKPNDPLPWDVVREVTDGITRQRAIGICKSCMTTGSVSLSKRLPPQAIIKMFQSKGWKLGNKTMECGDCRRGVVKARKEGPMSKAKNVTLIRAEPTRTAPTVAAKDLPAATPTVEEPTVNLRKQREIFDLLEEAFDEKEGYYRGGMSDKLIAETADMSVEFIAKLRREAFGEIKTDPKIIELADEFAELHSVLKDINNRVQKAIQDLDHHLGRLPK